MSRSAVDPLSVQPSEFRPIRASQGPSLRLISGAARVRPSTITTVARSSEFPFPINWNKAIWIVEVPQLSNGYHGNVNIEVM